MIQNMTHLQQVQIKSQNIEVTNIMNQIKLQNTGKTYKHENIMPWNLKSPKMNWNHTTWDYIPWKNFLDPVHT